MSACFVYTCLFFFFFNDTATTEIYTLSLHDALPISLRRARRARRSRARDARGLRVRPPPRLPGRAARLARPRGRLSQRDGDRKSTRLNSSHLVISYAVFCLKKKKIDIPCSTPRFTSA